MTEQRRMAIVGVSGVVGRAAAEHFRSLPGWEAFGLSRRAPVHGPDIAHIAVDLLDPESCREAVRSLGGVTHAAFAAVHEMPQLVEGWRSRQQTDANVTMLRNFLDAIAAEAADTFRHLTLLQGTKAYGIHLGPIKLPAKENDPRHMPPNFYFEQQDLTAERAQQQSWSYTVLRPQIVCGFALGNPMNLLMALGTYAAISRELGLALRFTGGEECFQEATDARLLARAIEWAATQPKCAGEVFNITNGDCFTWRNLWPAIASVFGMEVGYPQPTSLADLMGDKAPVWDQITAGHGLLPVPFEKLVGNWQFADYTFRYGTGRRDSLMSTIKARSAGFHDCIDSEQMFVELLRDLQVRRVLPF